MDVDVKNSLGKALAVCDAAGKRTGLPVVRTFIEDICSFITSVSAAGSKERYDYFNKVYLNGRYPYSELRTETSGTVPRTLETLIQINEKTPSEGLREVNTITAFFLVLGRYYAFSQPDRKDVSITDVTQQIKLMNDYVKDALPEAANEDQISQEQESADGRKKAENTKRGRTDKTGEKSRTSKKDKTDSEDNTDYPDNTGRIDTDDAGETNDAEQAEPEESLEELLDHLNSLIGLKAVKQEVQQIINLIKVQKKGEEFGEKLPPLSLHLVFFGNPGTGKTTVARLLAKIYKSLGVLSTGQMVEVDRGGLVAGYVGQTAIKTQEVIDKAMGGILFIDEAYSLTHGKGETDFGQEAVDTILKAMEDHRDDFIVIVAGYPDLMREFVVSNPGLKSRFNQFINFEDYTPDELKEIFMFQCRNQGLLLADDCDMYLTQHFEEMYSNRADDYANGRDVRNYFEKVIKARANRLASILDTITREEYMTIVLSDLQEAAKASQTI